MIGGIMDQNQTESIPVREPIQVTEKLPQLPSGIPVKQKAKTWPIILGALVLLALVVGFIVLMMATGSENVGKIRDIFIIFMALESLIIGIVLVILIVQLAVLINLIQNEIKPILKATNETVSTLKGTTAFISDNLTEPVIKLNEYLAGLSKLFEVLFPFRR
jgi:amino acid permease